MCTRSVEIYLIRHGLTLSNEQHRYLGKKDEQLSDKGKKEIVNSRNKFDILFCKKDVLYFTGPMARCVQTAELLFGTSSWEKSKLYQIPEWTEIDFGDFEGKNYKELSQNTDYKRWIESGGTLTFPNGESRAAFEKRSYTGFENMLMKASENTVAAILHGGNIMSIMSKLIGGDYYDYQVKPLCGYHIIVELSDTVKVIEAEEIK